MHVYKINKIRKKYAFFFGLPPVVFGILLGIRLQTTPAHGARRRALAPLYQTDLVKHMAAFLQFGTTLTDGCYAYGACIRLAHFGSPRAHAKVVPVEKSHMFGIGRALAPNHASLLFLRKRVKLVLFMGTISTVVSTRTCVFKLTYPISVAMPSLSASSAL